ncbi:MAG: DUF4105 domain-containing protein [Paludibacteraceae bacterium]|nr:DUF4105 domain-containing protein [Paludibacteraceae bacterium]
MKKRFNIFLLSLLLLVAGTFSVSAQIVDAEGQYVDTVFHDNVDRTAEDFVIASLLVADPGTVMYSVLGHACLRLQCPAFGMDYCFSYESEGVQNRVLDFLAGKLMMGLFAIPVEEYCDIYREEGRGVYEYTLNLPIEVKRELWRVLDEHLTEGQKLLYDYYRRGCAITAKDFVKEALGKTLIIYDRALYDDSPTGRDLVKANTTKALWVRFVACFISGNEVDKPLVGDRQLLIPMDLVHAWQQAKVNGEPLLASEPNILVEGEPQVADGWFTPMVLAVLLLVLSIINLWVKYPYFDWLMLAVQTLVGCFMTYLICFSDLCCTDWNWLIIPFNPLPLIFWYWRKYWALPYAGILAVWCLAMTAVILWGHVLVDWSHIVMVIAWIVTMLHQINTKITRLWRI